MSISNSLVNIELAEHQDVFLFCSFEPDKKLSVVILDLNKCKAFSGYATNKDLILQAASINMILSDFISLSSKALAKKQTEGNKFLYSLEKNCENFVFKWKSVDLEETIISIGSIKVTEKDYSLLIKEVFLLLSKEINNLNSKVSCMESELLSIRKEKESAVRLASEIADVKDRVENELFSKFILIFNEKKAEIRKLKRPHNGASVSNDKRKKAKTVSKSKKLHQISDSSDEAISDTTDKGEVAGPSTSKHNISLPFLDDNEQPILPSPSKRRIRQNNYAVGKVTNQEVKNYLNNTHKEIRKIIDESESEDELLLNL